MRALILFLAFVAQAVKISDISKTTQVPEETDLEVEQDLKVLDWDDNCFLYHKGVKAHEGTIRREGDDKVEEYKWYRDSYKYYFETARPDYSGFIDRIVFDSKDWFGNVSSFSFPYRTGLRQRIKYFCNWQMYKRALEATGN